MEIYILIVDMDILQWTFMKLNQPYTKKGEFFCVDIMFKPNSKPLWLYSGSDK